MALLAFSVEKRGNSLGNGQFCPLWHTAASTFCFTKPFKAPRRGDCRVPGGASPPRLEHTPSQHWAGVQLPLPRSTSAAHGQHPLTACSYTHTHPALPPKGRFDHCQISTHSNHTLSSMWARDCEPRNSAATVNPALLLPPECPSPAGTHQMAIHNDDRSECKTGQMLTSRASQPLGSSERGTERILFQATPSPSVFPEQLLCLLLQRGSNPVKAISLKPPILYEICQKNKAIFLRDLNSARRKTLQDFPF